MTVETLGPMYVHRAFQTEEHGTLSTSQRSSETPSAGTGLGHVTRHANQGLEGVDWLQSTPSQGCGGCSLEAHGPPNRNMGLWEKGDGC